MLLHVLQVANTVVVGTTHNMRLPIWPVISLVVVLALLLGIRRGRK